MCSAKLYNQTQAKIPPATNIVVDIEIMEDVPELIVTTGGVAVPVAVVFVRAAQDEKFFPPKNTPTV